MQPITVYPSRLQQFGNSKNCNFYLITNPELVDIFQIEQDASYKDTAILSIDKSEDFVDIIKNTVPDNSHILVISPHCLIQSVNPKELAKRKLLIFACNSAPTSIDAINHFLRCGEKTDPQQQENITAEFFTDIEEAENLIFYDNKYQTRAIFNHLNDDYGWHEQCGMLNWGQQQVFPAGEVACFLVPLKATEIDFNLRISLNGDIPLMGYPVLHSGPPSFLLEDQERIYKKLATMKEHAVIAKVVDGEITQIKAAHSSCLPAADILEKMFDVDSRFRIIYEIGFAINHHVVPYPANSAMNEVSAGENGTIHFGLGMLPYTQYHLDIICPGISVLGKDKKYIFGKKVQKINRMKSAQCPCLGHERG